MSDDALAAAAGDRLVTVGNAGDLAERERLIVDVGDDLSVGVFRVKGRLFAYKNRCWHRGGPVCQGILINRVVERLDDQRRSLGDFFAEDAVHLACPWHGYEYDVETGVHPADARVRLEPVRVYEDGGAIYLDLGGADGAGGP